jgi:hypothetical protein
MIKAIVTDIEGRSRAFGEHASTPERDWPRMAGPDAASGTMM